ncbi:ParB/RepB/Spo0J family partition protein [Cerasicoccus maritimus]|uniref:ParB/RepB/Spo0J family partition protein n=1 Tax=Cerasicoccus maritimus TaxID=490089 RepID=UPI0028525A03|nr:ParB/RepB/Spo0J family partition protein [Cerasicoccus maritimus]
MSTDRIHILNERSREAKRYESITQSVQNLGLKIPIVVSPQPRKPNKPLCYDLVCGQGRLQIYIAEEQKEIPARVIDIPKDGRLLMSLIENLARRSVRRYELSNEVIRLLDEGYSVTEISRKIDCSTTFVSGINQLHKNGEERLLRAVMNEKLSINIALAIAKASDSDAAQEMLMQAYERKEISGKILLEVKRMIDRREHLGKQEQRKAKSRKKPTDKDALIACYQGQVEKQKRMNQKVRACENRLLFIGEAFRRLCKDENFHNLLRAENLETMPQPLQELFKK